MGKSKKRSFNKVSENNSLILKRNEILKQIVDSIKNNRIDESTFKYICLFGIRTEELTEYGISYEQLTEVKHLLS